MRAAADESHASGALGEALEQLSGLGSSLVASYRALEARAERVEGELAIANRELERKVAELEALTRRVQALDKLAALGRMAGGIAHELRNPMHAMGGFAALLAQRVEPGSREREFAEHIVAAVADAESVLSSMLGLCSQQPLALESLDGKALARAAGEIALTEAGDAAGERWRFEARCSAPPFAGDRLKLRQALRNLITNAIQAQPDGGAIRVAVALDADDVCIQVDDTGPGVAPEVTARAFEPFFTTRAEGTGLGLALARTIAELHDGELAIDPRRSDLGGARVVLRIPHRSPPR